MISGMSSRLNSVYSGMAAGFGKLGRFEKKGMENVSDFASSVRSNSTDSVTISAGRYSSDSDFIDFLSRKLSSEVRIGAPERDMFHIKQQIAFGEYDIDAGDIADRIVS